MSGDVVQVTVPAGSTIGDVARAVTASLQATGGLINYIHLVHGAHAFRPWDDEHTLVSQYFNGLPSVNVSAERGT